ncbi:tyrosinase family protein [Rhizobium viscosum]|uniref:Tyrosinase n=1 Tax=Rhizobium viscosum TaxID=1673 RepID=A0ABR9IXR7_RHIVS|nr:tyrosinase family protein [Rhizobium viscosum]MBE1507936.1 tyrosinase [Rhizobium viscosum]
MMFVRKDVWKLPSGDQTLLWYGRAVERLQGLPISDVTSWWSLAAMHGIDEPIWRGFNVIPAGATLPAGPAQITLWRQCQHLTWYFLPWHRGYLLAFERIVRNAIIDLGGPKDWALPYWNYSADARSRQLPPAFAKDKLVSGQRNYLFVAQRYGTGQVPQAQSPIVLDPRAVTITDTLAERFFEGSAGGGSAGFGGVKTPFWHGDESNDGTFGVLETQPHGPVHVLVGGGFKGNGLSQDPLEIGWMTNPDTAALDPIFWLHHANIDRLWNVWLRQKRRPNDSADVFANPTDPDWLDGPQDREFAMPAVDGTIYNFKARDVLDTQSPSLNYIYDDEPAGEDLTTLVAARLQRLGATPEAAFQVAGTVSMAPPKQAELLGANSGTIKLADDVVETKVRLDKDQQQRLSTTLSVSPSIQKEPDKVYLNLENVKSPTDAAVFYVYVNLPGDADPSDDTEHLAGTLSMFGVSKASKREGPTGGSGINASFDITRIIDAAFAREGLAEEISVKLVSAVPGVTSEGISIGRISVYRQEQ